MLGILGLFGQLGVVLRHDTAHAPSARLCDTRATRKVGLLYARSGHHGERSSDANFVKIPCQTLQSLSSKCDTTYLQSTCGIEEKIDIGAMRRLHQVLPTRMVEDIETPKIWRHPPSSCHSLSHWWR